MDFRIDQCDSVCVSIASTFEFDGGAMLGDLTNHRPP
jgi:hypothetical protein